MNEKLNEEARVYLEFTESSTYLIFVRNNDFTGVVNTKID